MAKEVGKTKEAARQEAIAKYDTVKKLLTRPDVQKGINQMMGRYANRERMLQVVLNYVRQNEGLLDCSQSSLIAGIVGIFKLGLDPTLKQVHLIPFWNSKKKMMEATIIIDYRGKLALMKRTGEVSNVSAHPVYVNDQLQIQFGTSEFINHVPAEGERGDIRGAYIVVTYKDGSKSQDYMSLAEIEKRMAVSKTVEKKGDQLVAKDGTPWKEWFEEQCVKTVIHHHSKHVPMSIEEKLAEELDARADAGETQLDILPGSVEAILTGENSELGEEISPVVIFDEKAEKAIPAEDKALWEEYLKLAAEGNKKSIDEMKVFFSGDFDSFFSAFQRYKTKKEKSSAPAPGAEEKK